MAALDSLAHKINGLHWLRAELEHSLTRVRNALEQYLDAPGESHWLSEARDELRLVGGALGVMECYGASFLVDEMLALLEALLGDSIANRDEAFAALSAATLALSDYIDLLAAGEEDRAVVLQPLLNELRLARGQPVIVEADLFARQMQALRARPWRGVAAADAQAAQAAARRELAPFQAAFLQWFRGQNVIPALRQIAISLSRVADAAAEEALKEFWTVATAVAEALPRSAADSLDLKRLFGRAGSLLKLVAEHGEAPALPQLGDSTWHLLLFLGRIPEPSERGHELVQQARLAALLPDAATLDALRGRLRGPNTRILDRVYEEVGHEFAQVKDAIDLAVRTGGRTPLGTEALAERLQRIATTIGLLGLPAPQQALSNQVAVVRDLDPSSPAWMDVATAILRVEHSLGEALFRSASRNEERPLRSYDELIREIPLGQDLREGVAALIRESFIDLALLKSSIDNYLKTGDASGLGDAAALLREVGAGLAMLDHDNAAMLLSRLEAYVRSGALLALSGNRSEAERFADAIATVEVYLEALRDRLPQPDRLLEPLTVFIDGLQLHEPQSATALFGRRDAAAEAPIEADEVAAETAVDDGVDPEIREVFIEEAGEVLTDLQRKLPAFLRDPDNRPLLAEIRRAFHTLKGSGRMVGARRIGEFSWAVEQMLNQCLDGALAVRTPVLDSLQQAWTLLPPLLESFSSGALEPEGVDALIAQAEALASGRSGAEVDMYAVFREDARERLATVGRWLEAQDVMQERFAVPAELIRAFHTLRGAAAIVDAAAVATVSGALEGYLNGLQLAEQSLSPPGLALLADAVIALRGWVESFGEDDAPRADAAPWLQRIETLQSQLGGAAGPRREAVETYTFGALDEVQGIEQAVFNWAEKGGTRPQDVRNALDALAVAAARAGDSSTARIALALSERTEQAPPSPPAAYFETLQSLVESLYQFLDGYRAGALTSVEPVLARIALLPLAPPPDADEELLEIFRDEAAELLEEGTQALATWKTARANTVARDALRRVFHTLKGSARMAGLPVIGEVGQRLEKLVSAIGNGVDFNVGMERLQAGIDGVRQMFAALDRGETPMASALLATIDPNAQFAAAPPSKPAAPTATPPRSAAPPVAAPPVWPAPAEPTPAEPTPAQPLHAEGLSPGLPTLDIPAALAEALQAAVRESLVPTKPAAAEPPLLETAAPPTADFAASPGLPAELSTQPSTEPTSEPLLEGGVDFPGEFSGEFPGEAQFAPAAPASAEAPEDVAASLNLLPEFAVTTPDGAAEAVPPSAAAPEMLDGSGTPEWVLRDEPVVASEPESPQPWQPVSVTVPGAAPAAVESVGDETLPSALLPSELPLSEPVLDEPAMGGMGFGEAPPSETLPSEAPPGEAQIAASASDAAALAPFAAPGAEAPEEFRTDRFAAAPEWAAAPPLPTADEVSSDVAGEHSTAPAVAAQPPEPWSISEPFVEEIEPPSLPVTVEVIAPFDAAPEPLPEVAADASAPAMPAPAAPVFAAPPAPRELAGEPQAAPVDAELIEIFSAEAGELLDALQDSLGAWENGDEGSAVGEVQRTLHTLKGGARMAGIGAMGEATHELESEVNEWVARGVFPQPAAFAQLRAALEQLQAMHDRLLRGEPVGGVVKSAAMPASASTDSTPASAMAGTAMGAAAAGDDAPPRATVELPIPVEVAAQLPNWSGELFWKPDEELGGLAAQRRELARVPVDVLDAMLNQAGEISIYRSRLEQQNAALTTQISEMSQTVTRIREQLRQMDIETEAQVASRRRGPLAGESGETLDRYGPEFDPLEMDRYTRMQELSRALAESINDLASLRESMDEVVAEGDALLRQQGRINSEVQQGLMGTLMVPFSRQVGRLQRVVRQTAAENGKLADVHFTGVDAELDRNVLERMIAPLEHLLRNSVVHGIEPPATRVAAGKPAMGDIHVTLHREGSQLSLEVADDGAGLNYAAIRAKAVERGLMPPGAPLDDANVARFIFEPGFSTASQLTQDAGRGIGMDVVASEVRQLAGTLDLHSEAGHGTRFTIRLPLTLAVSQTLLVGVGNDVFALPLPAIDGIVRVPRRDAEQGEASPPLIYGEHSYPLRDLGDLVGLQRALPTDVRMFTTILLRIGEGVGAAGERRIALIVDQLLGNREIVSKAVGPQVGAVPGVAGATILPDGRVVLILDVPALIAERTRRALMAEAAAVIPPPPPLSDARELIMVVDDSVTMRRVAERLLERNGFRVVTAKDGLDAMAQLQTETPSTILLDIEMPRADGFEVAAFVRNTPRISSVPIIMITSRSGEKHRERARSLGVDRYLIKPYQEDQLLAEVKSVRAGGR